MVAAEPVTIALATVAAEELTPALATVPADPATAALATVPAEPATARLDVVAIEPATAVEFTVERDSTTEVSSRVSVHMRSIVAQSEHARRGFRGNSPVFRGTLPTLRSRRTSGTTT